MRICALVLLAALGGFLAGCGRDATGPSAADMTTSVLASDYASSMAAALDGGGIGAVNLPDALQLTTEQKAAIASLHAAFETANAADIAALKAIEAEARAAVQAGKTRDEVRAILAKGAAASARMMAAFARLQADIWAVYTPEQQAWITANRPKPCGPGGPPPLSEAQIQAIRSLQQIFMTTVQGDIATIRQTAEAARQAQLGGATRDQVQAILHQADAAVERVRRAERALQAAIDQVLTPEQRANRCGAGVLPGRP